MDLCDSYEIKMNLDQGVLEKDIQQDDFETMLDFCKVMIVLQTAIPQMPARKVLFNRSRLAVKISRDINQLKLPVRIERQILVRGEKEFWPVSFKYEKPDHHRTEVLVIAVDLYRKDPRQKAASVIASAVDLMKLSNRDLRVVYEVDGIGNIAEIKRAKSLIDEYQETFKYSTFNYAIKEERDRLVEMFRQDTNALI